VEEIDLATALYPFIMVSASGETSDMWKRNLSLAVLL
jgi:hypothetical protein